MEQDLINLVWPEWQVIRMIGNGSYGCVYEAIRDENSVKSHAAIKIISIPRNESETDSLRSEGMSDENIKSYYKGIVNKFINEITLMESLKGTQNIVSVEDYKVIEKSEIIGWDIYIRMELLTPLVKYLEGKRMTESDVVRLGTDICSALELCSKRGIIHCDIKPENIFVNDFGDFKLGDFGAAKKLGSQINDTSPKGTYNYMAPEVARGDNYGISVDMYSLGIVMYRFLNNNRLPFIETNDQQMNSEAREEAVKRRLRGEYLNAPVHASEWLADIVLKACAPDPRNRYRSPKEMKDALMRKNNVDDILDQTVSVRRAPLSESPIETPKNIINRKIYSNNRNKTPNKAIIIAVFAALVLIVGITLAVGSKDKDTSSEQTEKEVSKETSDEKDIDDYTEEETVQEAEDDASSVSEKREKFDRVVSEYVNKYTNCSAFISSPANSYVLLFWDDDDIPEIIYTNMQAYCLASTTNSPIYIRTFFEHDRFFYLEKEEMIMTVSRISEQDYVCDIYEYLRPDSFGGLSTIDKAVVKTDVYGFSTYTVGIKDDAPKEMFDDFLTKYNKNGKELKEIIFDYNDMYHNIEEAGEALWNETEVNNE